MKKILIVSILLGLLVLAACQKKAPKAETKTLETQHAFGDVAPQTAEMMKNAFGHYMQMKNAMVDEQAVDSRKSAAALRDVFKTFDSTTLTPEQNKVYNQYYAKIINNTEHIAGSADLSHQRLHLDPLTANIYALVKAFGAGQTVYYSYCPMANEDKGGYWLSESDQIRNPYFGVKMLECGEVSEVIK